MNKNEQLREALQGLIDKYGYSLLPDQIIALLSARIKEAVIGEENVAKIEAKMQSLGVEEASCCGKTFDRGEEMSAVVSDNGEPLGWYCDQCIENWKRKSDRGEENAKDY